MALEDAFVMNLGSNESDNKILGGQFLAELHHGRCMALGRVRDSEGMGDVLGSCHDGRSKEGLLMHFERFDDPQILQGSSILRRRRHVQRDGTPVRIANLELFLQPDK